MDTGNPSVKIKGLLNIKEKKDEILLVVSKAETPNTRRVITYYLERGISNFKTPILYIQRRTSLEGKNIHTIDSDLEAVLSRDSEVSGRIQSYAHKKAKEGYQIDYVSPATPLK